MTLVTTRAWIAALFLCLLGPLATAPAVAQDQPAWIRIRMATIGAADPVRVAAAYEARLGYRRREAGVISLAMAASWGAPGMAGRRYILLSPDGDPDVFIRIAEVRTPRGYHALTTAGWNGVEMIVDRIGPLYDALKGSELAVAAAPANPVKAFPTIRSMTAEGPAHETLYLTSETGDRSHSFLPLPSGQVGRPFVIWVTGPRILALRDWYARAFAMKVLPATDKPVETAGAPPGATMPNTVLLMTQPGNLIQFEGNPAQFAPRPHAPGQLPPGDAMASVEVRSLDGLPVTFAAPPRILYGGRRAATVLDPNGNRIELIEAAGP